MDNREYLREQYRLAISDFKVAGNEEQKWDARKAMARLEVTAIELYGNELLEELKKTI